MTEVRQPFILSKSALWLAGWLVLLVFAFQDAVTSLITVWYHSNTFNHGFVILPLIGWFIWRARHQLYSVRPRISWLAAVLGVLAMLLELLGAAAHINILQHLALAGMLLFGVVTFIGWRAASKIWFPLSLLVFIPPLGEELVPMFQQITADLAVEMLLLTGIPLYRDGLYLAIPNGQFEVAEACSGIRFFVACVFLGYLIACLQFRHIARRIAFILFATALPIVANGLRVYGTIIVGYYIDMKYAAGVDHLIYGWIFFFLVIIVLVCIGNYFSDTPPHPVPASDTLPPDAGWQKHAWPLAFAAVVVPVVLGFTMHSVIAGNEDSARVQVYPGQIPGMEPIRSSEHLLPVLRNPSGSLSGMVYSEGRPVTIFVGWYEQNQIDAELINWSNRIYDLDQWTLLSTSSILLSIPEQEINAAVLRLVNVHGQRRALVYWYDIPGLRSHNSVAVKLRQAINTLSGQSSGGALIAVSMPVTTETDGDLVRLLENAGIPISISNTIEFK